MRILEIILEDTKPKLRLIAGKWSWVLPDTSVVGSFNTQKEAMDAARKNPGMLQPRITAADTPDTSSTDEKKPFKSDPNRRKRRDKAPEDIPGVTDKKTTARNPDWWDKLRTRWNKKELKQKYDDWANSKENVWKNRLGKPFVYLLRVANVIEPVVQLYNELAKLELDFIEANAPFTGDDERDKIMYNMARNELWQDFLTSAGAIAATQTLGLVIKAIYYTTLLRRLVLVLSAGLTWGVGILAGVTLEAFTYWFQKWLQTPEGRDWWVYKFFEPFLRHGSKVVDAAWQGAWAAFNKAKGEGFKTPVDIATDTRNQKKDKSNTTSNSDNSVPPQPNQSNTEVKPSKKAAQPKQQQINKLPPEIRKWDGNNWIVGGIPVTDENGFLEPGIEYSIQVKNARKAAKTKGLPDPLADLPAAPGEQHPGPFEN